MTSLFECRVRYAKIDERSGKTTTVTELYLIDAISYTEAEERIHKEMEKYISGEFAVKGIKPANYSEVILDEIMADKYFKVKTTSVICDDNGLEKKTTDYTLYLSDNIKNALERAIKSNERMCVDYIIVNVSETAIVDFFQYNVQQASEDNKSKAFKDE